MAGTLSDQQNGVSEIERVANPDAVAGSVFAPRTNPVLQLAGALGDLQPEAATAAVNYAKIQEFKAEQSSRVDALKTKGAAFADAVRSGAIEPTQNPWYIMAYQRNAAMVQTRGAVADLNTQAAQWSEQNDPQAFASKYQAALSKIGENFKDPTAQEGFNSAAQPALDQALAQNVAYNVERIKAQRVEDLSSLAGNAVQKAVAARGGHTDPAKIEAAMAPFKADFLATGGTVAEWNAKIVPNAVIDAAFASNDPTIPLLAKGLKNEGGGSIYDQSGVAQQMQRASYEIDRQIKFASSQKMQELQFAQEQQVRAIEGEVFKKYGPGIYSGQFDEEAAIQDLSKRYPPAALARAFQSIASTSNSIRELAANRTGAFESSQGGSMEINSLYSEAQMRGWSEGFENDIGKLLLNGNISDQTAVDLRARALATSKEQAPALPGSPGSGPVRRGKLIENWGGARDAATKAADTAESTARQAGAAFLSPQEHSELQRSVVDAVGNFLEANPKAFNQVGPIAAQAAVAWVLNHQMKNNPDTPP